MNQASTIFGKVFWIAGAYNVFGMLAFSRLFTNPMLAAIDPNVFPLVGQVAIVLWGFAYWSAARSYRHVPLLVLVFAIEKLVYSIAWLKWLFEKGSTIPAIAAESPTTALFFSAYGAGDFIFFLLFAWVAWKHRKSAGQH